MTKLNTTLLRDLDVKTTIGEDDYVIVTSPSTKKMKIKDITKDIEKKAVVLEEKTAELGSQLDTITQQETIINVMRPPLGSGLTSCKIDGVTDDTLALKEIFKYVKNNKKYTKIILPKTGFDMIISDNCQLERSNIEIEINCNIKFNSIVHKNVFTIGGDNINSSVTLKGSNIVIDGNGNNMEYLNYVVGSTPSYCCVAFKRIDGLKVSGIKFENGLVECVTVLDCRNISFDNCEFNGSLYDNGLSIYNTLYNTIYNEKDESTWTNAIIRNCKANNCMDFGMTAFKSVNVIFENCISTNCGNKLEEQANKGGGYSAENYDIERNAQIKFLNCKAISCVGRGIYADADGVFIDENCEFIDIKSGIPDTISPTNDQLNNINGIGVRCNNNNVTIGGIFRNCIKGIVHQSWNNEKTYDVILKNIDIDTTDDLGIYVDGANSLIIDTLNLKNTCKVSGTKAIYLSNLNNFVSKNAYLLKGTGNAENGIYGLNIVNSSHNGQTGDLLNNISSSNVDTLNCGGSFNSNHLVIGKHHLWTYNNSLRVKTTNPTYNTDGDLLYRPFTSKTVENNANTIDASDIDLIIVNNTVATTLSTITGSYNGKIITIVSTSNNNTTLEHSGVAQGIRLNSKANMVLSQNVPVRLQYFNYSWYQI